MGRPAARIGAKVARASKAHRISRWWPVARPTLSPKGIHTSPTCTQPNLNSELDAEAMSSVVASPKTCCGDATLPSSNPSRSDNCCWSPSGAFSPFPVLGMPAAPSQAQQQLQAARFCKELPPSWPGRRDLPRPVITIHTYGFKDEIRSFPPGLLENSRPGTHYSTSSPHSMRHRLFNAMGTERNASQHVVDTQGAAAGNTF